MKAYLNGKLVYIQSMEMAHCLFINKANGHKGLVYLPKSTQFIAKMYLQTNISKQ